MSTQKIHITFVVLLIITIVSGCTTNKYSPKSKIVNKFYEKFNENISFANIYSLIDEIPLEGNDSNYISYISKFLPIDTTSYLILDYQIGNKIHRFDRKGKFRNFIGQKGECPECYSSPASIVVLDDTACVYDNMGRIILYDLNGEFIRSWKVKYSYAGMVGMNDSKIIMKRSFYYNA